MTNFDRIKECPTPEEMAKLLDNGDGSFCPSQNCLDSSSTQFCHDCITEWLRGEAKE